MQIELLILLVLALMFAMYWMNGAGAMCSAYEKMTSILKGKTPFAEHNVGEVVFDPTSNTTKELFDQSDLFQFGGGVVRNKTEDFAQLSAHNMNSVFIDPNGDGPEKAVEFNIDKFIPATRDELADKPKAVLTRGIMHQESFDPPQRQLGESFVPATRDTLQQPASERFVPATRDTLQQPASERFVPATRDELARENFSEFGTNAYNDRNMKGCPNILPIYSGAYQRIYAMTGDDKHGNLIYSWWGRSKEDAQRRWKMNFPGCALPKAIE